MRVSIDNLIVEVTRRCNFACDHCLRGDAESKDLDVKHVETLFKDIDYIGVLTFTGGEPQLAVQQIIDILRLAEEHKVDVNSFYVATNGAINSKEFVLAMLDWYLYCEDNESSSIDLSTDKYHQYEQEVNEDSLYLNALKFFNVKDPKVYVIQEGRGENFGTGRVNTKEPLRYEIWGDDLRVEGEFYMTVAGDIVAGCDWSYENMPDNTVGHVSAGIEALLENMENMTEEECV